MKYKFIFLISILFGLTPAMFADVVLAVDPVAQTKFLGEQAIVNITSSGGYVGDFDLDISWNPAIVSLFSINYGTQLGGPVNSIQNPPLQGAGTVNASEISFLSPGDLLALQPGPAAILLTLTFDTIGLGISPVNIGVVKIGDENGLAPNISTTPGSIEVIARTGVVPEPSMLLGVGGILAVALWRMRRARA